MSKVKPEHAAQDSTRQKIVNYKVSHQTWCNHRHTGYILCTVIIIISSLNWSSVLCTDPTAAILLLDVQSTYVDARLLSIALFSVASCPMSEDTMVIEDLDSPVIMSLTQMPPTSSLASNKPVWMHYNKLSIVMYLFTFTETLFFTVITVESGY